MGFSKDDAQATGSMADKFQKNDGPSFGSQVASYLKSRYPIMGSAFNAGNNQQTQDTSLMRSDYLPEQSPLPDYKDMLTNPLPKKSTTDGLATILKFFA